MASGTLRTLNIASYDFSKYAPTTTRRLLYNRVSELVGLGVLQYVSRRPLLFALEHCKGCYRDYQWWLTVREDGENYVDPENREAADFGK
jgi:hypothetical protein